MRLEELDFDFPESLVAQHPCEPRDACRLLAADPRTGVIAHRRFRDIEHLVQPGDLLVVNESKVFPARAWVRKQTGGKVELLFLRRLDGREEPPTPDTPAPTPTPPAAIASSAAGRSAGSQRELWEVLARPSARLRAGQVLSLEGGEALELVSPCGDGRWTVARDGTPGVLELLDTYGAMPLPPYIHEPLRDERDYQTVYANVTGSAAAPTAGLHFTTELIEALRNRGVAVRGVTLHVGVDTFRPLTETRIEDHVIHSEWYHVSRDAADSIDEARASGRRVIAVGTTAVRVLETLYRDSAPGEGTTAPLDGATRVYITPGYTFRAVDALLTNFHLPRTSLLALVMAFGGVGFVRDCYEAAVAERYRFFSFGDAMFLSARGAHS